jgi:hypothetical protein
MKRMLLVLVAAVSFGFSGLALAQDAKPAAADKPDCTEKQKAADDAKAAAKAVAKPDLSSCKEMKGKEKADCEKPLKDKAKEDTTAAKTAVKDAQMALACCKNPKKKGCAPM